MRNPLDKERRRYRSSLDAAAGGASQDFYVPGTGAGGKELVRCGYRRTSMKWLICACLLIVVTMLSCGDPTNEERDAPGTHGDQLLYECASGFPFDPFRFEAGDAENGDDAVSQALRDLLEWDEGSILPRSGWTRVGRRGNQVAFVARDDEGNFYDASVQKERGAWGFAGLGECGPGPKLALGELSVVEWVLNPDERAPEEGNLVIHALVNELSCHGFEDPLDRIQEPRVLRHGDETYIALSAEPLGGFQTCPGTPWVPFEIELDEPLASTELFDASVYPPRPADREAG